MKSEEEREIVIDIREEIKSQVEGKGEVHQTAMPYACGNKPNGPSRLEVVARE